MSMQDPIADMLTRIRNAQGRALPEVALPSSNVLFAIANVLKENGYIEDCVIEDADKNKRPNLRVLLKYFRGKGVIDKIDRISRPGLRNYVSLRDLPKVSGGYGIAILSTSKGVMTDQQAKGFGVGGEVLCHVT